MRIQRRICVFCLGLFFQPAFAFAQSEQPAPPPQDAPSAPRASAESSNKKKTSSRHQHDFLIKGTVFTQEGLSFAGARIRIRKTGDKSFHWHDEANSRGEFAIRVIQGAQYEVVVDAKGFKEQLKQVDATGSDRIQEVVFHMEREGGKSS
ncbi:MAG TPA: carboxypeptidase-like regulatory domain-containing protein [Candidatus Acidoferrum sp.]|nr:carboxypeptidase-like regulatory domain-containing protein [Candidatus Acidoferrum sp.]